MIENLFGGSAETINILGGIGFFAVCLITGWVLYVYAQAIKSSKSEGELAPEEWDGLKEYKNPLPVGWALIFTLSLVWALWYWLVGYPLSAYSQIGEWNQENNEYKAKFEEKWNNPSIDTLKAMGESIFLSKCSQCHGNTADGLNGKAANLVEYGSEKHIAYVVKNGSKGLNYPGGEMPAGLMSDDNEVKEVAKFVASKLTSGGKGAELYGMYCASCHGEDGTGTFGTFPDLTKYGTVEYTANIIHKGKKGHIGSMPAFEKEGTLSDIQYKALSTYILSLGE